jgi:ApaG protein
METGHSDLTTQGIRVRVAAQLHAGDSNPGQRVYVYAYKVVIENVGDERARLISRHWVVRDANGERRDVKGPGVVGEHPDLAPGQSFEYVSGCHLATEWGTMEGSYRMRRPDGSEFEARIGRFFLAPNAAPIAAMDRR